MSLKKRAPVKGAKRPALLLLDSDRPYTVTLARHLRSQGFEVTAAYTACSAYEVVLSTGIDYAIIDPRLKDDNGLSVLAAIRLRQPRCRIIVVTSYASIETAVAAIRLGAKDYLVKPTTPEHIKSALLGGGLPDTPVFTPNELKLQHIVNVLRACDGNVSETARQLKMHRRTLQRVISRVKSDTTDPLGVAVAKVGSKPMKDRSSRYDAAF